MKTIAPSYYPRFHCLCGACRHTCCAGWEIDISREALEKYNSLPGTLRTWLLENIDLSPEPHFRLRENGACPFWNADGLCEIILRLGEGYLTEICRDHPRFLNFFSDRTEIGLGLCCEVAARLILTEEEPFRYLVLQEGEESTPPMQEEQLLTDFRNGLHALISNRALPVAERLNRLQADVSACAADFFTGGGISFLLSLERLDDAWTNALSALSGKSVCEIVCSPELALPAENLMHTLVFRHLAGALSDGMRSERAAACAYLTALVLLLSETDAAASARDKVGRFCDCARMMSGEIEYSDENLEALLEYIEDMRCQNRFS